MTTSQPDALPEISSELAPLTNAEGCVCVVAGYVRAASMLDPATRDAGRRIMMTPALGDFVELSFVNMGPEPGPGADHSAGVRLITETVLAAGGDAACSDFAIVVADASAAVAEGVLAECATSPFLATLPMRWHGITAADDRDSARDIAGGQITVAGQGAWNHEFLVSELRRYAEELMRYFASAREGITQDELGSLRARYEQHLVQDNNGETLALPPAAVPEAPVPAPAASPPEPPQPATPAVSRPGPPDPPEAAESEPAPGRLRRLLDGRRRRGRPSAPASAAASALASAAEPNTPRACGLAYFLVIGDALADDPPAWQRSRSTLLAVDQKIAALPGAEYAIRLLDGDEQALRGDLRPAGQLARRDVRDPVSDADFAGVLNEIRTLVRRDMARSSGSGKAAARPAVLFFASEPPLADSVTAEVFGELAREAVVIWVIPKEMKDLLASAFAGPPGAHVVDSRDEAADDIADLLSADAGARLP